MFPSICFARRNFYLKDHVIAASRWQRAAARVAGRGSGQIVAQQKYDRAKLGFDDRNRLSFGNEFVESDQYCLDFSGCCRCHRNFHLHGFDECNLVAIADAGTGLSSERAYAARNVGDNLDIWHPTLRDRVT
jgi:hypothetical protein